MTPAARLSAAIEIVADIEARHRPAPEALKDWGLSHRFAGSGDRAALAGLVYDALRRRASSVHVMGDPSPRAILLGMLRLERKLEADAIAALANGERFAPQPLSAEEQTRLAVPDLEGAPPWVAGDYPEWLDPYLTRVFGEERAAEGAALASRAPLDLRVNDIKGDRDEAAALLEDLNPVPTRWSPFGLRIALEAGAKNPAIHAEPAFIKGMIEVQDEGSQLAALLAGAKPGEHVVDLCAGAGGKTLALGAQMRNTGRLYAFDVSGHRLAALKPRLARSGLANVHPAQIAHERDDRVKRLAGKIDRVLVDAPCSGSGTLRRNPDLKWRQSADSVAALVPTQAAILAAAARLVKPGGRLVYATCSVLAAEGEEVALEFDLASTAQFTRVPAAEALQQARVADAAALVSDNDLRLWTHRHATDGFFAALWERR
jgi:16S rRNA (cytosine967-C5)-methyltransferase